MTEVALEERFARVCKRHEAVCAPAPFGDALRCPGRKGRGAHTTTKWMVVDLLKSRIYNVASVENGHEEELQMPMKTGEKAVKGKLASAKFASGNTLLWLHLEFHPKGEESQRYRVRWTRLITGTKGKGNSETGVTVAVAKEAEGRAAFDRLAAQSKKVGWEERAVGAGRRSLTFKPLPAPPTAARR